MRYVSVVSFILLELAWLLLLICMLLPIGGHTYRGVSISFNGAAVAILGLQFGGFFLLAFIMNTGADPILTNVAIAIFLSDLLFIASPFILLLLRSGHITSRSIYLVLNVLCVILLARLTPNIVDHLDPNHTRGVPMLVQLLPGFLVWLSAQVVLTLAAGISLIPLQRPSQ